MLDTPSIGRWLFISGIVLAILGGAVWLAEKSGLPWSKIPGDFRFQFGSISCFIPLASSIILSILLTILLNLILRGLNK